jgi:hypothetical protein
MNVRNPDITGPCRHLKTGAGYALNLNYQERTTHPVLTGKGGSPNLHKGYSLAWLASECELALRSCVSNSDADIFLDAPLHRIMSLWRTPESGRAEEAIWNSLAALPQHIQEALAAGFELIGRKPLV